MPFCEWGGGGATDLIIFLSFILAAVTARNVSKREGHASADTSSSLPPAPGSIQ